jgi:hypothetical protein
MLSLVVKLIVPRFTYGQAPDFETVLEDSVSPPEVVTVVEEQLDWPPPELDDPAPCTPLELPAPTIDDCTLGPAELEEKVLLGVELVPAPEEVEQLPELPLTAV